MDDTFPIQPAPLPVGPRRYPWWHWRRFGLNFLTISIAVHLLFGVVATYLIVQTIQAKRKQTFAGPPQGPNAPTRAIEHKVQMQKKQQTMSAPAPVKRITTTSNARVALPAMPAMPKMDSAVTPLAMAGMGGTGMGLGMGLGGGGAGGGGGGGGPSLFGLRTSTKGLRGTFYDLKQSPNKTPTTIKDISSFVHQLDLFLQGGWNEGLLDKYYKAPTPLYASQIFVPHIASAEAPKAFGVEKEVQPSFWMALYKGQVSPPEDGTYYFTGGGDNILIVRLNGKIVLDKSWDYQARFGIDRDWKPTAVYDYHFSKTPGGFNRGLPVEMKAGEYYDMEILLGDDGGVTYFSLLVEKQGVGYNKTSAGLPILPVFRLSQDPPPKGEQPPFQPGGPVWSSRAPLLPTSG